MVGYSYNQVLRRSISIRHDDKVEFKLKEKDLGDMPKDKLDLTLEFGLIVIWLVF